MKRLGTRLLVVALVGVLAAVLIRCGGGGESSGPPLTGIDNATGAAQVVSANYQASDLAAGVSLNLLKYGGMGFFEYAPLDSYAEALSSSGGPGGLSPSRILADAPLSQNPVLAKGAALASKLRQSAAVRDVFTAVRSGAAPLAPMTDTGTRTSPYGGHYTYTFTEDSAAGTYSISITFFNYREYREDPVEGIDEPVEINGTLTESGRATITYGSSSVTLGFSCTSTLGTSTSAPLTVKVYSSGFGTVEEQESAYVTINMGMKLTEYISGDKSYNVTFSVPSGSMNYNNYSEGYTKSLVFNKMTIAVGGTIEMDGTIIGSITANGGCAYRTTEPGTIQGINISYSSFRIGSATYYATFQEATIDGRFSVSFDPALACTGGASFAGGTYSFETITPVHYDYGSGSTTAGEIVINGVATVLYNANGTVTVTVGDSSEPFPSESIMESYCWI